MNIINRLLATCSKRKSSDEVVEFFAADFLRRLLLFEHYILDSIRLEEIPHLIRIFGYTPTLELIRSGKLLIHYETFTGYGSTGHLASVLESRRKKGNLPLCSYCLDPLAIHPYDSPYIGRNRSYRENQERFVNKGFTVIDGIDGISHKQANILKSEIAARIISFRNGSIINQITELIRRDLGIIDPSIKLSIALQIKKFTKIDFDPQEIHLQIEFLDQQKHDFRVTSNIEKKLHIDRETVHKIIERALLGITKINHSFIQMKEFNCLVGYRESEIPILGEKLNFFFSKFSEKKLIDNFTRILKVKALPDFNQALNEQGIDLLKILEIAESKEWVEFRNWLLSQDEINEQELKTQIYSLPQRVRDFYESARGKIVSFLVSTGLGLVSTPIGIGLSFLETFVLDKILPRKGAITFINNKLPSIYKKPSFNDKTEIMDQIED